MTTELMRREAMQKSHPNNRNGREYFKKWPNVLILEPIFVFYFDSVTKIFVFVMILRLE